MNFKFNNSKYKKPTKVIILGKSGIISTNLQKELKEQKICFAAYGRPKIDLRNKNSKKKLLKEIKESKIVVFISSEAPVKNIDMFNNNLKICKNVCEVLEKKNIKNLIYISSDAVYSDSKNKLSEKSELFPNSLHGQMHLTREFILKKKFENILCILRPTLIYGFGDTHSGYGPNQFIKLALKNKKISIFGNGEEERDHIFIDDLIKIIIKCICRRGAGVLNLASGKVYSFKHIAQSIIKLTKSNSKIKKIKRKGPMPHNGYRPFNIDLLKKNFKEIKISNLKIGIQKYLLEINS